MNMLIRVFGTEFLFTAPFFHEGQWRGRFGSCDNFKIISL
jgi:hypothetical protein